MYECYNKNMGGCTPSKSRIIQQPNSQSKSQAMQHPNPNPDIPISLLVTQLYNISLSHDYQKQSKPAVMLSKLQPRISAKCEQIAQYFVKLLQKFQTNKQNHQILQNIKECAVVAAWIVQQGTHFGAFKNINKKQLNLFGQYIQRQNNANALDYCVIFVQKMFLDHECAIYATAEDLFSALIKKFGDYHSDQTRELATQILVQMLLDNKKLLRLANQPYIFLEFWLYSINKQPQLDRQMYWIDSIKKIYSSDASAEDCLFYDSDFKVFIDLLVRLIYSCPDGPKLKQLLECYLVLSCTKKMKGKMWKIDDVIQYLAAIDTHALGIQQIVGQINMLK